MGGEAHNDHVNHMKDIPEVQHIQLRPLICRGVARSVHLIHSVDRNLGREGHPQQYHLVPQGHLLSMKC